MGNPAAWRYSPQSVASSAGGFANRIALADAGGTFVIAVLVVFGSLQHHRRPAIAFEDTGKEIGRGFTARGTAHWHINTPQLGCLIELVLADNCGNRGLNPVGFVFNLHSFGINAVEHMQAAIGKA